MKPIIAIDGPAGAGKSTIAKLTADRLGYLYIDTGAMYRAVALKVIENGIPLSDDGRITALANSVQLEFQKLDNVQHIFADGNDVTEAIRSAEATRLSSPVSAILGVRRRLVDQQQQMGADGGVVMEGRDIGTVVFPSAQVKIFLTASAGERAKRRAEQLMENGIEANVTQIESDIRERDFLDSTRSHAPLRQAADGVLLETDNMTIDQVVDKVIAIHDEKVGH